MKIVVLLLVHRRVMKRFAVGPRSLPRQRRLLSNDAAFFISRHARIDATTVVNYVESRLGKESKNNWRDNGDRITVKLCPTEAFCAEPSNFEKRERKPDKFQIWKDGGSYFCNRCQAKGSYYQLKYKWSGAEEYAVETSGRSHQVVKEDGAGLSKSAQATSSDYLPDQKAMLRLLRNFVTEQESSGPVKKFLRDRGLGLAVAFQFGVGCALRKFRDDESGKYERHDCLTFPWIVGKKTVRVKVRSVQEKRAMRIEPKGGGWGLFGLHTVPEDAKEVVLTEGELDALSVAQDTGRFAVSVPNGASSLPPHVLPLLERFDKIYLWMDNDSAGQTAIEKFSAKLGSYRCFVVRPPNEWGEDPPKDANEALMRGLKLDDAISQAAIPTNENLIRFGDIRNEVVREIMNPDMFNGLPLPSLPGLTSILRGARTGELTLLTGHTGSGKTTLVSQMTLDFVKQGTPTLWGSFEVNNVQLVKKMLRQFSPRFNLPLTEFTQDQLEHLCDRFELLPLHFMKFHGATDVEDVIDAMTYARYAHDVEHVVLDNLQFMISTGAHQNKFDVQDNAIAKFREFATRANVHVVLVVHPKKTDAAARLDEYSIYGGVKAVQEADNVVILQSTASAAAPGEALTQAPIKNIEVVKNRYVGTTGAVQVVFNPEQVRYFELNMDRSEDP